MNNSKQAVLSIVGIAILVIAVVGVSFAFFTYSKNGTTENVITTGSISFNSTNDEGALALNNKFPQTNEEGVANQDYDFTVTGTIPSTANPVHYGVFLVKGNMPTNPAGLDADNVFENEEISVKLTATGGGNVISPWNATGADDDSNALTDAVDTTQGLLVGYGTVAADGNAATHSYSLVMWVNETVGISDTSNTGIYKYRAHHWNAETWNEYPSGTTGSADEANRKTYSDMWYSLKVNVEARDTTPYYVPQP